MINQATNGCECAQHSVTALLYWAVYLWEKESLSFNQMSGWEQYFLSSGKIYRLSKIKIFVITKRGKEWVWYTSRQKKPFDKDKWWPSLSLAYFHWKAGILIAGRKLCVEKYCLLEYTLPMVQTLPFYANQLLYLNFIIIIRNCWKNLPMMMIIMIELVWLPRIVLQVSEKGPPTEE